MSILSKQIVVRLNSAWQAYEVTTVEKAITFLCSENGGQKPGFAIDFETTTDSHGNITLTYAQPIPWDEWVKLPVREQDLAIGIGPDPRTGEPRAIRVPLVVICAHYGDLPKRRVRWSPDAVRRRDKDTCQITKRKLAPGEGNTGHIIARSKGGPDSFTNTIYMDKRLNTKQGTRTPEEMGWTIEPPREPVAKRVLTKEDAKHPTQLPFLS